MITPQSVANKLLLALPLPRMAPVDRLRGNFIDVGRAIGPTTEVGREFPADAIPAVSIEDVEEELMVVIVAPVAKFCGKKGKHGKTNYDKLLNKEMEGLK